MRSTRLVKIAIGSLRVTWGILSLVLTSASFCYSADLIFIRSTEGPYTEQQQLEIATNFYGLNLKVITASSINDGPAISRVIEREETVGVAITARALSLVNQNALARALHHNQGKTTPLLVLGVTPDVDPTLLRTWSGGVASGCRRLENPHHLQYIFGRIDGLTWQLAGLEVPLPFKEASYLVLDNDSAARRITSVQNDDHVSPVFIETTVQQLKVFVACATPLDGESTEEEGVVNAFLRIGPAMLFIKYCSGERGWHTLNHYANLTIDDPWLRQPYGYVDYRGLLAEMERHNFHTTIAFIPWNYDRSEPGVVSLFRRNPERFSVAIHGDNHDHKEFTDFRTKPLDVQIADLKQSLARMEKFRTLTGVPYDKVMIFPHSIAPEKTLEALKTYNYLATINSTNVPQGTVTPFAPSFSLRPVTLSFAGLPSISRYSVAAPIPTGLIAINEFLGNPLLFYCHSDFFAKGIDAFDGVASEVNKLEPDTQWSSLGELVRHLYIVKLRDDSDYDVLTFSSSTCLDNVSRRDSIYYVQKQEVGNQVINSVLVEGQQHPYLFRNGYLNFTVSVPAGETRCLVIQYENDLQLASIDTSKHSFVVYLLRIFSDFRDIYLSKSILGLAIIRFYNEHNIKPAQVLGSVLVFWWFVYMRVTVCSY